MRSAPFALVLGLSLTLAACSQGGVGSPCFPGGQDQPGNLKVLLGTGECTTNICVSYLGSSGYCTVECADVGACPSGYLCCPVVQTGEQRACTTTEDCPSPARQTCRQNVCRPKQFCVQGTGACQ
jgi:hypothetical protein